jgi:YD repeat-containing protein
MGTFESRWRFDSRGRPTTADTRVAYGTNASVRYDYDQLGRLRVMDFVSTERGRELDRAELAYDGQGHLVRVRRHGEATVRFWYDDEGRLVRQRGRRIDRRLRYEGHRLVELEWTSSFGHHVIVLDRDEADRVVAVRFTFRGPRDESCRESYRYTLRYDDHDRLIRLDVTYPDRDRGEMRSWSYDEEGRLVAAARATTVDGEDRGYNPTVFRYDAEGRLASTSHGEGSSGRSYRYEGNCQLVDTAPRPATPVELAHGVACAGIPTTGICSPGGLFPLGGRWGI